MTDRHEPGEPGNLTPAERQVFCAALEGYITAAPHRPPGDIVKDALKIVSACKRERLI